MEEIQNLFHEKLTTKNEYDILLEGTETPSFYAKPKIHKTYQDIPTFRPICNSIGSSSVRMSLSRKNSSYIKDTTDFLNKVSKIHNSPETKKKKTYLSFHECSNPISKYTLYELC